MRLPVALGARDAAKAVVGVHGVGGLVGTLALAVFGAPVFGGFMTEPVVRQLGIQTAASLGLGLYTAAASYACLKATSAVTGGLRVPEEAETAPEGLDGFCFDEHVYTLEEGERPRAKHVE